MDTIKKGDTLLGLYKVESDVIDDGGAALVYKVRHTAWNKEMAMKLPRADKNSSTEKFSKILRSECAMWISLGIHPNIAFCYYTRDIGDTLAVFSEWAENGTLADSIRSGRLYKKDAPRRIIRAALESMRGLAYAHSRGLIHKDIKPSNIIVTSDGGAKLNDFGLSELRSGDARIVSPDGLPTLAYTSPEQIDGGGVTSAADIYSWALTVLTLYIGKVGRDAWGEDGIEAGERAGALLGKSKLPVPGKMKDLLLKCLGRKPEDRPGDAEIIDTLEKLYESEFKEAFPAQYSPKVFECARHMDWMLNNRALVCLDLGAADKARTYWETALRFSPNHLESMYNLDLFNRTSLFDMMKNLELLKAEDSEMYGEVKQAAEDPGPVRSYPINGDVVNAMPGSGGSELLVQLGAGSVISLDLKSGKTKPVKTDAGFPKFNDFLYQNSLIYEKKDSSGGPVEIRVNYKMMDIFHNRRTQSAGAFTEIYELDGENRRAVRRYPENEVVFPIVFLPDSDRFIAYSANSKAMVTRDLPKPCSLGYRLSETAVLNDELRGIDNMLKLLGEAEDAVHNEDFREAAEIIKQLEQGHEFRYQWRRFYTLKRTVGSACGKKNFRILTEKLLFKQRINTVRFSSGREVIGIVCDGSYRAELYSSDGTLLTTFTKDDFLEHIEHTRLVNFQFRDIYFMREFCRFDVYYEYEEYMGDGYVDICSRVEPFTFDMERGCFVDNEFFPEYVFGDNDEDLSDKDKILSETEPDIDLTLYNRAEAQILFDVETRGECLFNSDYSAFLEFVEEDGGTSVYLRQLDFDIADTRDKGNLFAKFGIFYPRYIDGIYIDGVSSEDGSILGLEESAMDIDENEILDKTESNITALADTADRLNKMRNKLIQEVIGQEHAVQMFTEGMFKALMRTDEKRRGPKAIFTFAGPPGVGKTMLAETAAEMLGLPYKRFDMTEYSHKEASNSLIGWDSTYKSASKGVLTGFVQENPGSILLFDEIEKASLDVMHVFYQMLDDGFMTDKYLATFPETDKDGKTDPKVSFRDTIIIFTTNAGRSIYEKEGFISGANISLQDMLRAFGTEKDPLTGAGFFPGALISRISTGYPIMFSNHVPASLMKIIENRFRAVGEDIRSKYGIDISADERLFMSLLFREGGKADARMITAKTENFIYEELYRIAGVSRRAIMQTKKLCFKVELDSAPSDVRELYESQRKLNILVCAGKDFYNNRSLIKYNIYSAHNVEQALAFAKRDIDLAVIELMPSDSDRESGSVTSPLDDKTAYDDPTADKTSYAVPSAKYWGDTNRLFKALRSEHFEIPVYILENTANNISRELIMSYLREGAKGSLSYGRGADINEQLSDISKSVHMQASANELALGLRRLDFETVFTNPAEIPGSAEKAVNIKLRNFRLIGQTSGANGESDNSLRNADKPKERFKDVVGASAAKAALQDYLTFFKDPRKSLESGMDLPKGVLLYGPPGTGKTMLAKALAGECGVAFFSASAGDLIPNRFVGTGASAVRDLFANARKYAPSIIFIDEVDAFARKRDDTHQGYDESLNTFLTEMDGFVTDPKKPVFLLAATNLRNSLDRAFTRRFDREILVDLPNLDERKEFIGNILKKLNENNGGIKISAADIREAAKRTNGLSPADIKNVIYNAVQDARMKKEPFNVRHILDALELRTHGEKHEMSEEDKLQTARHEAGHALINYLSGYKPAYLTIVSRGNFGGYMARSEEELKKMYLTRADMLKDIRCSLAGRAAEIVYYGRELGITSGASGDLKHATEIAREMIVNLGMDDEFGLAVIELQPDEITHDVRRRINDVLNIEMENAMRDIKEHRKQIDKLAAELMKKGSLTSEKIVRILSGTPARKKRTPDTVENK